MSTHPIPSHVPFSANNWSTFLGKSLINGSKLKTGPIITGQRNLGSQGRLQFTGLLKNPLHFLSLKFPSPWSFISLGSMHSNYSTFTFTVCSSILGRHIPLHAHSALRWMAVEAPLPSPFTHSIMCLQLTAWRWGRDRHRLNLISSSANVRCY